MAMASSLLPITHLRIKARELLVDQLALEGVSEQGRADADELARQMWSGDTADIVMERIMDVLPTAEYKALLAFCNDKYPLLYSTLPAKLKGTDKRISWPQHSSYYRGDMLASAAHRATYSLGRQGQTGSTLGPVPSPGSAGLN